jgi:purine catabolism regulator
MGISVKKMLDAEFFKDYKVLAGHGGLNKQIQGIAIFDAPDGFYWTRGREFLISSGYVFLQNPTLFEEYISTEYFRNISCFGIKVDRYLKKIPDNIIKAFNEHDVPLISIPSKDSWMDIMNAINVTVMNKNISQFNIGELNSQKFSDLSYRVRKINKILSAIEYEMNFSAMLYDLSNEEAYYSSSHFKEVSKGLKLEDFWNPSFNYSKEILCDNLKMVRYRFYDDKYEKPFSWITVPIIVDNKIKAYFVLIEATGLIDFFDQFAIRAGFLLIQELYEHILVAQSIADAGFEKFINSILTGKLHVKDEIINKANEINIGINNKCYAVIMRQTNADVILSGYRDLLKSCISGTFVHRDCRMSLIEDNKCLFLIKRDDSFSERENISRIQEKMRNLEKRLELKIDNVQLVFGLSDTADFIYEIKRNYERAEQGINIGKLLYPKDNFWSYSQLGAFAWLDIKDDEMNMMLADLHVLLNNEEHKDLVYTLKAYLECKMNFSLTAKKLYLHINTIRKRIEEITDLTNLDLDNPMNRLKLEILLKLFY